MATNRAPQVEAVAGLFLGLAWITTILRLYVKGFMAKVFGLEDWLAVLAVLLFTATAVFALAGISHSMGMHLAEIPLTNLAPAMMYWFSTELSYVMTTCVLKLSIIVFLLRIATQKAHKIILYITMSIVISVTIAYFFFLVFQCSPVDYFWNQFSGEVGSCLSPTIVGGMTYAHSGVNAGTDVVLAVLPVVIVSQLQMNIRTKLTVSSILSLGLLAAVAVIIRIPFVKILVDNASDFLYSSTDVVLWSAIEPGLGITAANMATLRPLFSTFLSRSKLLGGTTTAKDKSTAYTASKSKSGFSSRNGYVRSGSKGGEEEFEMAKGGVTTIVQGDGYDSEKGGPGLAITTSEERLDPSTPEWDTEAQKDLSRPKASEDWPIAIRKTVRMEVFSETLETLETLEAGWEPRDSQLSMMSLDSPATRISHTPSLGGLTPHGW